MATPCTRHAVLALLTAGGVACDGPEPAPPVSRAVQLVEPAGPALRWVRVDGTVVGPDGAPEQGVAIGRWPLDGSAPTLVSQTDASGRWTAQANPGDHLGVAHLDASPSRIEVVEGQISARVALAESPCTVPVHAQEPATSRSGPVHVWREGARPDTHLPVASLRAGERTNAVLPCGERVTLRLSGPGGLGVPDDRRPLDGVVVVPRDNTPTVSMPLAPSRPFDLQLRASSGGPAAHVAVAVLPWGHEAWTDADGTATLWLPTAKNWSVFGHLSVDAPGYTPTRSPAPFAVGIERWWHDSLYRPIGNWTSGRGVLTWEATLPAIRDVAVTCDGIPTESCRQVRLRCLPLEPTGRQVRAASPCRADGDRVLCSCPAGAPAQIWGGLEASPVDAGATTARVRFAQATGGVRVRVENPPGGCVLDVEVPRLERVLRGITRPFDDAEQTHHSRRYDCADGAVDVQHLAPGAWRLSLRGSSRPQAAPLWTERVVVDETMLDLATIRLGGRR